MTKKSEQIVTFFLMLLLSVTALLVVGSVIANYADNWDEIVDNSYELNGFLHDIIDN